MRSDLKIRTTVNSTVSALPSDALENVLDSASPCCASNKSNCFKENININKSETPNLSLEPFQMKRKKKGGGSNLRKSLAWNRAFFTEEVVNRIILNNLYIKKACNGKCWQSCRRHSSVNTSPLLVQKANNSGSEMISSSLTAAKPVNSSEGQRESLNFATPRNAHVRDMTIPSHNQVMKPSGLRMPSPSLSFFSQSSATCHREIQKQMFVGLVNLKIQGCTTALEEHPRLIIKSQRV
ncbi:hypothetical protein MIMGU_mgv11b023888mg [Erythranthe guttata]|uniref:Uncharacterized protein n=1 Tax=Erythranthe guttata TaxID=4155 RepID=A0A022R904_ERYGU|nr:hypothetical protein MIMGU_mgv11b023888mg [Erythranthe guttata]